MENEALDEEEGDLEEEMIRERECIEALKRLADIRSKRSREASAVDREGGNAVTSVTVTDVKEETGPTGNALFGGGGTPVPGARSGSDLTATGVDRPVGSGGENRPPSIVGARKTSDPTAIGVGKFIGSAS